MYREVALWRHIRRRILRRRYPAAGRASQPCLVLRLRRGPLP